MLWFIYSIITSLSFVGMIFCVRKLTDDGFHAKQILFFLTGFVFFGFIVLNIISPGNIWWSEKFIDFLLTMLIVGIFSVIGNWADFEAIKRAPNPGYPVAIRNSTILFITLISAIIFNSDFGLFEFFGSILILGGTIALVIEEDDSIIVETREKSWYQLALLALFGFTIMALAHKQGTLIPGVSTKEINLLMFGFNFIAFAFFTRNESRSYFTEKAKLKRFLPWIFLASIFSFLANFFSIIGLSLAPNPGYHEAIKNTNFLFISLLSVKLFSSKFEGRKILGVIAIMLGVTILVI